MFAGCIERKCVASDIGSALLNQMTNGGLAKFPSQNKASWEGVLGDEYLVTIIEQSIHENESHAIECNDDVLVAGWLRIDNKDQLYSTLKLPKDTSDRQLIIESYRKWGEQLCENLYGDFSFVVIDFNQQRCLLCRDQMGVRPLYYYQDETRFIFATSMAVFFEFDVLNINFSMEFIVRYCSSVATDWRLTAYEELFKLPPAHIGIVSVKESQKDNFFSVKSYFQFDQNKRLILASEQAYIDRYKEYLDESVRCCVEGVDGVLASESSGGIDSSTVTAVASKFIPKSEKSLHAFGLVTEIQEEECIMMMSEFLNLKHTYLFKENEEDFQRMREAEDAFGDYSATPSTASIATAHAPIYHKAKSVGAKVLLSGFGGDEFVTIYGATARVELFKRRQWKVWFSLFKGGFLTKKLRAIKWLMRFYINQNRFETAQSLLAMSSYLIKNKVIKNDFYERYKVAKILTNRGSYDSGCHSINEFSLKNRWSPDMVARLEECSLAAASYGFEYRWPLLDVRLIEFFLSVPSEYKLKEGVPRYLHRKAIQGVVPEHLIWKDKDMGGALRSQNDAFQAIEIDEMLNHETLNFDCLHESVKRIIDQHKWEALVDQLSHQPDEKGNKFAMQMFLSIMQPVLSLSDWLKGFKKA